MLNKFKIAPIFIIFIAVALLLYKTGIILPQHKPVKNHVYEAIETLELADTPERTAQGLMWREDLCDNCGMLFVFEPEQFVHMWMKNTPTSLDMLFLNKQGVIIAIAKNTVPFQVSPTYTANQKTKYVIEMKAGFVDRENLKVGMQFDIKRLRAIVAQHPSIKVRNTNAMNLTTRNQGNINTNTHKYIHVALR